MKIDTNPNHKGESLMNDTPITTSNAPPPSGDTPAPLRRRPPTHGVYQIVEADGQSYKMKVGSGTYLGDTLQVVTIHGEFEIVRYRKQHILH